MNGQSTVTFCIQTGPSETTQEGAMPTPCHAWKEERLMNG